jgi:molecular chaperone DnaJ
MSEDYYSILGVSREATFDDIKRAYRKLAIKYHPDKNDSANAEARFKKINEAYSTLSDKNKKAQYDHRGSSFSGAFGGNAGFSMDDIFRTHFSRGFTTQAQTTPSKGQSIRLTVDVSLYEILIGTEKTITINIQEPCPECLGTTAKSKETCSHCRGAGVILQEQRRGNMFMSTHAMCPSCNGKGFIIKEICTKCTNGLVNSTLNLNFSIPRGVKDGGHIILHGKGPKGLNGGPKGDILLFFNVVYPDVSSLTEEDLQFLKRVLDVKRS